MTTPSDRLSTDSVSHTLFVSDLHLSPRAPEITALFLDFLATRAVQAEALYILGDLFDQWLGDDDENAFTQEVIAGIRAATAGGLPIFIMRGNHDFLLGERFFAATGAMELTDPSVIRLYHRDILLVHGDSLCEGDRRHQWYRRFMYAKLMIRFFYCLSLSTRQKIANFLDRKSTNYYRQIHPTKADVTAEAVDREMRAAGVDLLIHGHTHRPAIHGVPAGHRVVLGAWHEGVHCLAYTAEGDFL